MGLPPIPPAAPRLASVDAYRGLVMALMLGEILHLAAVAKSYPGNAVWEFLAFHQEHVPWVGCSLHDLIQPSFSFLVGVSLPFSIAARRARGQSPVGMSLHAFWRAFLLVAIGTFLRSLGRSVPDYGFTDTLCQIGLGYGFLFLLGFAPRWGQWAAVGVILAGYWSYFALSPAAGDDFDWTAVGVKPEWVAQNGLTGFAGHWNMNANPAHRFDVWLLNKFPREKPFAFSNGGYVVLSFLPTLATMILGLLAGGVLKSDRPAWGKVRWLAVAGVVGLAAGYALGLLGVCPVVKRIWTPSWVLFSGGWCALFLAGFYAAMDVAGWKRWAFPLVVVGANSIAAYCMSSLVKPVVHKSFACFLGDKSAKAVGLDGGLFSALGDGYEPLLHGAATLAVLWLILLWMYRQKVFIRV